MEETPNTEAAESAEATENASADEEKNAATEPHTVDQLPEWAQKEIRTARKQAAENRVKAKTATEDAKTAANQARDEITRAIASALGLSKEQDATPTVDDIKQQLEAENAARRAADLELAIYKASSGLHVDPLALTDSRSFMSKAADIDPADTEALQDAIKAAVKNNPKLGAVQAAGASSTDTPGQAPGTVTLEQFKNMGYTERMELAISDPEAFRRLDEQL